jgi:hypothetical protein
VPHTNLFIHRLQGFGTLNETVTLAKFAPQIETCFFPWFDVTDILLVSSEDSHLSKSDRRDFLLLVYNPRQLEASGESAGATARVYPPQIARRRKSLRCIFPHGALRSASLGTRIGRRTLLLKHFLLLSILTALWPPALRAQAEKRNTQEATTWYRRPESAAWFPRNWVRGFVDFSVAPSHNEPDLGRCAFPQPAGSGGANSQCTAYARYLAGGYVEMQPLNRTPGRHIFVFFEPKFSFGRNIPQTSYLASIEPIAYDRSVGVGIELPRSFSLRVTQHQVDFLGRYSNSLGPADLHTTGPYGLYTTIGVRWSFGGFDRSSSPY